MKRITALTVSSFAAFALAPGERGARSMIDARTWLLHAVTVVLILLGIAIPTTTAQARKSYEFTAIAFVGDPAPGGDFFTNDFEPYGINNRGDVLFVADLTTATGGEGVFLERKGHTSALARSGDPAPGGGTFFGAPATGGVPVPSLNGPGDVAFGFLLETCNPAFFNVGLYRYSHASRVVTPVIVPCVTPAPQGGTFVGAWLHPSLNNKGDLVFTAVLPTEAGPAGNGQGLGLGIFKADENKAGISSLVIPGDRAPGGSTFDFAENPWINNRGDVAFGAHVAGEECIPIFAPDFLFFCGESVYLMIAATGEIRSIAHQGDPAPGGGTFRLAFEPIINNRGDIAFTGDLTPAPDFVQSLGFFLHSGHKTLPVARPGDPLPGGGNFLTASAFVGSYDLNNHGDVSFLATLDTTAANGVADTGLYVRTRGSLHLVARSGTVIPGVGKIVTVLRPDSPFGGVINDRGQILFTATLDNGDVVLLVATPSEEEDDQDGDEQ